MEKEFVRHCGDHDLVIEPSAYVIASEKQPSIVLKRHNCIFKCSPIELMTISHSHVHHQHKRREQVVNIVGGDFLMSFCVWDAYDWACEGLFELVER